MTLPFPKHHRQLTRRRFVELSAVGLWIAARPPVLGDSGQKLRLRRLSLRYLTDPERIARFLPPPLEPSETPEVLVEYAQVDPATAAETSGGAPSSAAGLPFPVSYGWSGMYVAARYEQREGTLPVGMWTSHEWGRWNARESLGWNVKEGRLTLEREGANVHAAVRRRHAVLHRLDTTVADPAASQVDRASLARSSRFAFRYRLHPDWHQSLGDDPVELWQVEAPPTALEDADSDGSGVSAKEGPSVFACNLEQTTFRWLTASALEPGIEFPVVETEAAFFEEHVIEPGREPPGPASTRQSVFLTSVPSEEFQPWALLNYERPIRDEKPWAPNGWRETETALKLSPDELESYRDHKEIRLGPLELIDIHLAVDPRVLADVLPPPLQPGSRLRVVALRADASEISPEPFQEIWLFAFGVLGGRRVWYALSHIAGPGGDLILGRETFGYPSKRGEIEVVHTPVDFSVSGRRRGRDFIYADGAFQGFSMGTSLLEMEIAGLRAGPFNGGKPSRGELVVQPWYFQGPRSFVNRESVLLEFPPAKQGQMNDPWFEFNPLRVLSVSAMQHGTMQRAPGQVLAAVPEFAPFYAERCDGRLPGEPRPAEPVQPGFRVKREAETRSSLFPARA